MARSRSTLLSLAALAALAGCCVCAPQGSVQGGVQGGAQVPPGVPHSTAPPAGVGGVRRSPCRRSEQYKCRIEMPLYTNSPYEFCNFRFSQIQSVFQRARLPRLAHARRPDAHKFTLAQPAATRYSKAAWERGSVHSAGAADRVRDGGGGVLAVGQLLVARPGGHPRGRLTRDGGRVHARVAPAVRARARQPLGRGLAVPRAAGARAAARPPAPPPLPWRLPPPTL